MEAQKRSYNRKKGNKRLVQTTLIKNDELENMIAYIARHNLAGENHIGFYGESETEIRETLGEFAHPLTKYFLAAREGDEIVGIFGVDHDMEIGRAWLFGPLVTAKDWRQTSEALHLEAQKLIPAGIREQDFFFDVQNIKGCEFAEQHGFSLRSENAIFVLDRQDYKRHPRVENKIKVTEYEGYFFDQFKALHDALFPNTYLTAGQVIEKLDDRRHLYIAVENERLLGYHFCKIEAESGYVDFIGVDSSARERNLGTALLASGLEWMFAAPTTQKVSLTVNADNAAANSLYKKFGFSAQRIMRGYRKTTT
jgi:hypothetical protein